VAAAETLRTMSRADAPHPPLRRTVARPAAGPADPAVLPPPGDAVAGDHDRIDRDGTDRDGTDRDGTDRDGTDRIDAQPGGYEAV
jgi:hypothetical protein